MAGIGRLLLSFSLPLAGVALGSLAIVLAARKLSPFERALMSIALWTGALSVVMLIAGLALYLFGRVFMERGADGRSTMVEPDGRTVVLV